MKIGDYNWDTKVELRTRCEMSCRLPGGHQFFTAGKTPLATATLEPDCQTLDITIWVDRVAALMPNAAAHRTDGAAGGKDHE